MQLPLLEDLRKLLFSRLMKRSSVLEISSFERLVVKTEKMRGRD